MNVVYRKTDKGQTEIGTRAFGLSLRLRQALILVDGRKTDGEISKLILADAASALSTLLDQGFIEAVRTRVDVPPAVVTAPSQPAMSVDTLKREAVRYLLDKLGPNAERLAIKLERAKNLAEVQPLLATAVQALRGGGRNAQADEFTARFVTPLQG